MADGGSDGSNWWGEWIQAAKEKTVSALEVLQHDLSEFTCTVQNDTQDAMVQSTNALKDTLSKEQTASATSKMKEGFVHFLGGISKALTIPPDDDDDNQEIRMTSTGPELFDRAKARLHAIQLDPGTYCNPPDGPAEEFEAWKATFSMEDQKGDVSELLVSKVEVRALYTKLVPSTVSHADFWQRYFYKVHQLEQDEKRKAALKKRADDVTEELAWEGDDWDDLEAPPSPTKNAPPSPTRKAPPSPPKQALPSSGSKKDQIQDQVMLQSPQKQISPVGDKTQADLKCDSKNEKVANQTAKPGVIEPSLVGPGMQAHTNTPEKEGDVTEQITIKGADNDKDKQSVTESKIPFQPKGLLNQPDLDTTDKEEKTSENKLENKLPNQPGSEMKQTPQEVVKPEPLITKSTFDTIQVEHAPEADSSVSSEDLTPRPAEATCSKDIELDKKPEVTVLESSGDEEVKEIKTKEKGSFVMIGSDRTTPTSDSTNKESSSLGDEWDIDLEVTEEDVRLATEAAKKLTSAGVAKDILEDDIGDDWEDWE